MKVVGGLFEDEQDLIRALEAVNDKGFVAIKVFGPDELFREPGAEEEMEESVENVGHTGSGTISGISVNPRPIIPDESSAQPVTDDLVQLGFTEEMAEDFVAGLHQDHLLLLLRTKAARAEEAEQTLQQNGARLTHTHHPEDAFPEEQWREPRE